MNLPETTIYKGNKTKITYNGNEKRFSFMLCINANGKLLNPIVIKKGKTQRCLKNVLPKSFIGCYSNNGCNKGILKILFENIKNYTNNTPSVLLFDCFSHKNEETIKIAEEYNIKLIFIPPGKTDKYQPLDVKIYA